MLPLLPCTQEGPVWCLGWLGQLSLHFMTGDSLSHVPSVAHGCKQTVPSPAAAFL